jgi:hypothetical protein
MTKYKSPGELATQYNARQHKQFATAYNTVTDNIAARGAGGLPPFSEIVSILNDSLSKKGVVEHVTPTRNSNGLIQSMLKEQVPEGEAYAYQLVGVVGALYDHLNAFLSVCGESSKPTAKKAGA